MTNIKQLYSVVLLKESIISEQKNQDNTKVFEESIILMSTDENFFEDNSQIELIEYFKKHIPSLQYENGYGETVTSSIVYVVDYFEIIDSIVVNDFIEVYSRNFVETIGTSVKDVIDKYYGGFVYK